MRFNKHSTLEGAHALLSASKYSWVNYDEDRLEDYVRVSQAAALGTRLHALAAEHIRLKIRMPKNKATFNSYVNDAIGFGMEPEVVLFYSTNCFGTADAIKFDEKRKKLRIHDLKTGVGRVSISQLEIYAALFCLEYGFRPGEIQTELRIYQNDGIVVEEPPPDRITRVVDKIVSFDQIIERLKEG